MNKCATCKWWTRGERHWNSVTRELGEAYEVYVDPEHKNGNYTRHEVIAQYDVRECKSPLLRFYEVPSANGAAVCDGSDYWAGLFTGPEFGCQNHEPSGVTEV